MNSLSYASLDAIGVIRRELSSSYPYSAGSVTINCAGYDRKTLLEVLKYFMERHCSININYEKNQVKISGYLC
jgi:hypothetical protein